MPQDEGQKLRVPSAFPAQFIEKPAEEVYRTADVNEHVEQSAIYADVPFGAQGGYKSLGIVLTAQCDIERFTDDSYMLVARVQPIDGVFGLWLEKSLKYTEAEILGDVPVAAGKTERKRACEQFAVKYLRNRVVKYYFLPKLPDAIAASLVCCEITQCIQVKEIEQLRKVCVLCSPFREAVPVHYAAYIGRIGTPVFTDEQLMATLDSICKIQPST